MDKFILVTDSNSHERIILQQCFWRKRKKKNWRKNFLYNFSHTACFTVAAMLYIFYFRFSSYLFLLCFGFFTDIAAAFFYDNIKFSSRLFFYNPNLTNLIFLFAKLLLLLLFTMFMLIFHFSLEFFFSLLSSTYSWKHALHRVGVGVGARG